MKKILNDPANLVLESLQGLAEAHPDMVALHLDPLFVLRSTTVVPRTVAVLSGGGSGHEPLHGGFVGIGMLDAAVPGPVFSSPTPDAILAAARSVDAGAGVLFLVKNYAGDVLNFEMAAELAAAEGLRTVTVLIDDDVAVTDSTWTTGRRGVGGTVVVEKIAGAAATRGDDLNEVAAVAARVVRSVNSMGLALRAGTVPHTGELSFALGPDEYEMGVGIHGEPGRETRSMVRADEIVADLLEAVLAERTGSGDEVLLFVNGLGGTPVAELYLAFHSARRRLGEQGLRVTRSLVGTFVTSLDMQGFSLTVLDLDDELRELWDAPVCTPALRRGM